MKKHLASIVIIIILLFMIIYLWKTNTDTFSSNYSFANSKPTITNVSRVPNTTNYLSNQIDLGKSIINESKFTVLDNQNRINNIEKRINKIKTDLATLNTPNNKTTKNNFTFY